MYSHGTSAPREPVQDDGISLGLSRLTPERIARTTQAFLKNETGARLKT
jgi:hypothetical protein